MHHNSLVVQIAKYGARLESPTMQFSQNSDLGLEEGMRASSRRKSG